MKIRSNSKLVRFLQHKCLKFDNLLRKYKENHITTVLIRYYPKISEAILKFINVNSFLTARNVVGAVLRKGKELTRIYKNEQNRIRMDKNG